MSARRPRPVRKPVSRTPAWVVPAAVLAGVAVIVAAFLVYRYYNTKPPPAPLSVDTTQAVVAALAAVPQSTLDAAGQGSADNRIKPVSGQPLLGSTGKPEVFYFGAEYCPFCAAQRWPLIVAMSRFGTFSGLKTTSSSSTDVYPNTPTFTFHGAVYSSATIDFRAVETQDRNGNQLESASAQDLALVGKYDTGNSIPFVDVGNRYAFEGAMFSPDLLSGMSWQAVSGSLTQQGSSQAAAILGSANLITAAICAVTGNQPASACSSQTIQGLEKKLG